MVLKHSGEKEGTGTSHKFPSQLAVTLSPALPILTQAGESVRPWTMERGRHFFVPPLTVGERTKEKEKRAGKNPIDAETISNNRVFLVSKFEYTAQHALVHEQKKDDTI